MHFECAKCIQMSAAFFFHSSAVCLLVRVSAFRSGFCGASTAEIFARRRCNVENSVDGTNKVRENEQMSEENREREREKKKMCMAARK